MVASAFWPAGNSHPILGQKFHFWSLPWSCHPPQRLPSEFPALLGAPAPSPVSHPAGEVQAGVLEVPLEVGQQEVAAALGAHVGRAAAVHALVGAEAAAVGQDHGARRAHLAKPGT